MTTEDAISRLETMLNDQRRHQSTLPTTRNDYFAQDIEALEMAIKALERQVSKRPLKMEWVNDIRCGLCPTCGQAVDNVFDKKHCQHFGCGQTLDWTVDLEF